MLLLKLRVRQSGDVLFLFRQHNQFCVFDTKYCREHWKHNRRGTFSQHVHNCADTLSFHNCHPVLKVFAFQASTKRLEPFRPGSFRSTSFFQLFLRRTLSPVVCSSCQQLLFPTQSNDRSSQQPSLSPPQNFCQTNKFCLPSSSCPS